ncbi:zinc finger CCHC domain-containing protein 7 [Brienomyrus brachyistius]|uniref:zinc finger CCHC domain-containing protein 7 n=1 Tax=Brienomyrus brachyistius TaxID=42636 RepID=UPI0020B33B3F|nr:zinc finger CCHC domain-containing protein 7 [Brienomyrus brachyistius]XP_048851967.1 zinc finger CCHC domain-containing protein 7 [Brienomyrus brachyistius]XP_048851968.1 zinc finger CCHC domain-containing protein 7 [Brienomyrus brachyistius]
MYSEYQEREEYEDELYKDEDGSSSSEVDSELEFRLYSQLHYCSSSGQQENRKGQQENRKEQQENRKEQQENRKGLEGNRKGQQENRQQQAVIVIDSGPEVVTLSDSTEDEEGVCMSKGLKSQPPGFAYARRLPPQSTPRDLSVDKAPGGTSWVNSIITLGSDSDLTLDSDSDDLENWMILGQNKREGDCRIQLNLEGMGNSSPTEDGDDTSQIWTISKRDIMAQISNRRPGARYTTNRYYNDKTVTCRSCNKLGHLSKNCRQPKLPSCLLCGNQGHFQQKCPRRHCANCGRPGHGYKDCVERASWTKQCYRCAMPGHFHDECPEIWRQYHLTTKTGPPVKPDREAPPRSPAYCYNCSRKGHFGFECKERRMFNGTYPTAPCIYYYDTEKDICCRNKRMAKKVQDLQETGLLVQSQPDQTLTVGGEEEDQPRKKRKLTKGLVRKQHKDKKASTQGKSEQKEAGQEKKAGKRHHLLSKPWQQKRKERRQQKKQRRGWAAQQPAAPRDPEDFPRGPKKRTGTPMSAHKGKGTPGLFNHADKGLKGRQRRPRGRDRKPENLYPTDENLFLIKQRRKK